MGDTNAVNGEVEKEDGYGLLFQMVTEQRDAGQIARSPCSGGFAAPELRETEQSCFLPEEAEYNQQPTSSRPG